MRNSARALLVSLSLFPAVGLWADESPTSRPADVFVNKKLAPDELAEYRAELKAAAERYSLAAYRQEAGGEAQSAQRKKAEADQAADNLAAREAILAKNKFRENIREHPRRRTHILSRHLARMDRIGTQNRQEKALAADEAAQKTQSAAALQREVSALQSLIVPLAQGAVHLAYEQDRAFAAAFQQALGEMAEAGRALGRTSHSEFRREASDKLEDAFSEVTETLALRGPNITTMALTHFHSGLRAGLTQQSLRGLSIYVATAWRSVNPASQSDGQLSAEATRAREHWLAEAKQIEMSSQASPAERTDRPRGERPKNRAGRPRER